MGTNAPIALTADAVIVGSKPAFVGTIRVNSPGIRGIERVCNRPGGTILIRACGRDAIALPVTQELLREMVREYATATFEFIGNPDDLAYLIGHPSIVHFDWIHQTVNGLDARAAGSGAPKR